MMKPFAKHLLTVPKRIFKYILSRARNQYLEIYLLDTGQPFGLPFYQTTTES